MSSNHHRLRWLLLACALMLSPSSLAATVLENPLWRVELDPATLRINVNPTQRPSVQASAGVSAHKVSHLVRTANRLDWQWDDGAWILSVTLDQRNLNFSISARDPAELEFLRQPGSAMGNALIWPLAEGHYVPAGDAVWQRFLLEQGEFNTTQDLSLPMWGVDHGAFTLNWLLTNPFNNRLLFNTDGEALALSARHEFTTLDPAAALTFSLFLGDADPLSGARRYRQWLIDTGTYEPLSAKLLETPEGKKLLGAAHVYLWGGGLLGPDDVRDWPRLWALLQGEGALAAQLRQGFDRPTLQMLREAPPAPYAYQRSVLLRSLNAGMNRLARQHWQNDQEPNPARMVQAYVTLREALSSEFKTALTLTPERWGDGVSLRMMQQLRAANLPRLWLGLGEAWEAGLWHPEAIRAGVDAGFLVAPYDSYETALPAGGNPDWTTAHLGADAYERCAIVLKSGERQSGFLNSGHYTDPRCTRPLMEARITAIQARAGFNSWFLDVTAAGMLFDSYRAEAPLTQADNALGNIDAARWINQALQLPMGSEDGNAVTAQGILFAHGMQTPVIGWDDEAMHKDAQSPYYLGHWFPPEQPGVFFDPVQLKPEYRHLYVDPSLRLPLYQAVFHGSVITSHHWVFDSLKLSNVRAENELTQLLYNVPPLYHLSRETLKQRLPIMARQDGFFRPLHERLAMQALTDFRWLSEDRLVQQTTFADGTRLVANFDDRPRQVDSKTFARRSVSAFVPGQAMTHYQVD